MAKNRRRNQQRRASKAPMARNVNGAIVSTSMTGSVAATGVATAPVAVAAPLPRDTFPYAFGPGIALQPAPLDPVRRDSGRAEPRIFEYDVSWNLPDAGNRHRLVPWKTLRDAADNIPLFRRCIEIRKNETVAIGWDIALSKRAVQTAQRNDPGRPRAQVEDELRREMDQQIDRCEQFWRMPDRGNGYTFAEWLGQLLEEHYVLDALAIYPRYTYGGDLFSLEVLDGSTIKPLLDNRGGRPAPPHPAYQQIVHGFPRGEFTADAVTDSDGAQVLNGGYPSDQLIYIRRAVRTWTPYGYSAVEQALNDGDLYMRRYQWLKSEYTDGVMPSGWMRNGDASGWTPQQLLEYERDFNDFYSGSTSNRRRFRMLPPGVEPVDSQDISERYKPEYDLHLIKLLCAHFDTGIAELGFTEAKGLGSTGYHEGQADVQERKATLPMLRWLSSILTDISRQHLGMPEELEFRFLGLEEEDENAADEVADRRLASARMTLNEDRDRMGMPRYPFPEADMPMVKTSRGVIFLEGASQLVPPGETLTSVEAPARSDANADGLADSEEQPPTEPGHQEADPAARAEAVKAEFAAFQRWAAKRVNHTPRRPFVCKTLTESDAPDLAGDARIVFADLGAGDGAGPKAGDRPSRWPGWDRDLTSAAVWAPRITQSMTGAVDARALAERWLAAHLAKGDAAPADVTAVDYTNDDGADSDSWAVAMALDFLLRHNITVVPAMAFLRLVWLEGYAIGHASAAVLLDGRDRVTAWGWAEGDTDTAAATLPDGARARFETWTRQASTWATSIGGNRLKAIANVLASGRGQDTPTLAARITAVLADTAWARSVAVTEITRAAAQAARDAYRGDSIRQVRWGAEPDACDVCHANAEAGPTPIGVTFPGDLEAPPQHTSCRCWIYPADPGNA